MEPIVGAQLAAEGDPLPVLQRTRGAFCLGRLKGTSGLERSALGLLCEDRERACDLCSKKEDDI